MDQFHEPVLLEETIKYLNVQRGKKYLDCTVGGGGHSLAILKHGGKVLGIDRDPTAVETARDFLRSRLPADSWANFTLVQGNFTNLVSLARQNDFTDLAGVLFDLGISNWQIKSSGRGFTFQENQPLDMRMNPELEVKAADLVNALTAAELEKLFRKYGEENASRKIARKIVAERKVQPIQTTQRLVEIIEQVKSRGRSKIHPATLVFQALRIAVNDEINNLEKTLPEAFNQLSVKGRIVVISFHSLEDRVVKHYFKDQAAERKLTVLTSRPVQPGRQEVETNPSSRSAKLRAAEKK